MIIKSCQEPQREPKPAMIASMAADESKPLQIAAHLTAGWLGHRLVDAQLVDARTAFEVEVVQQVDDNVARNGPVLPWLRDAGKVLEVAWLAGIAKGPGRQRSTF